MTTTEKEIQSDNIQSSLPSGWIETTLGEVIEILDGDRGSNYPNGDDFTSDGYCLFLNTKNVPGTQFSFSEKMFITQEKDNLLRKGKLQRGDYVITTRGTIGNFAYYHSGIPFDHIRINSGMVVLRIDPKHVHEKYFGKYLNSSLFKHQFTSLQSGSAVPQLPIKDIKTFTIVLPPISEQEIIASLLSSFDDKIELLREENKTLELTAQTIFQEQFGKYGVDDELPEGWRVGKLGEIAEIASGKRPENASDKKTETNQIPLIGATKIMGYVADYLFNERILIIGRVGTHGEIQIFNEKIWPSDNTLVIKAEKFVFVYLILKNIDYVKMNRGAVQPLITQTDMKNYPIVLPSQDIFDSFKNATNPIFEKIENNNLQIKSLSQTRDELLPRLMKGEVRVGF